MNVSMDKSMGPADATWLPLGSIRKSVAMMLFFLEFKGAFAPSKTFVILNLDSGSLSGPLRSCLLPWSLP